MNETHTWRKERNSPQVTDLNAEGEGIARVGDREVELPLTIPGDRVRARNPEARRQPAQAAVLEREVPPPAWLPALCPHYELCGGCAWQDVDYPAQIQLKERIVRANLTEVPASAPGRSWGWRPPGSSEQDGIHLRSGSHARPPSARGAIGDLVDILGLLAAIPFSPTRSETPFATTPGRMREPYIKRTHLGEARHLVICEGKRTGEVLLNLVSRSTPSPPGVPGAGAGDPRALSGGCLVLTGRISLEKGDAIKATARRSSGKLQIREILDGIEFLIGTKTFFQTITIQAGAPLRGGRWPARRTLGMVPALSSSISTRRGHVCALDRAPLSRSAWLRSGAGRGSVIPPRRIPTQRD